MRRVLLRVGCLFHKYKRSVLTQLYFESSYKRKDSIYNISINKMEKDKPNYVIHENNTALFS